MANYTLQSHGGAGLYMTADGTPTARRNVYIKARVSASLDQTWRIDSPSNGARTRIFSCKSNNTGGYALNNATATNNCDIISHIDNYKDSLVEFERYGTNVYYIKCITNGRYLTADGTAANSNVSWQVKASSEAQRWKLSVVSEGAGPFSVSSFSDGLTNNALIQVAIQRVQFTSFLPLKNCDLQLLLQETMNTFFLEAMLWYMAVRTFMTVTWSMISPSR